MIIHDSVRNVCVTARNVRITWPPCCTLVGCNDLCTDKLCVWCVAPQWSSPRCKAADSKNDAACACRWLFWSFFCSFLVVGGYFNLLIHFINNHRWRFSGIRHTCCEKEPYCDLHPGKHCCCHCACCTLYYPSLSQHQHLMLMLPTCLS